MIILPYQNKILQSIVLGKLQSEKHEACEHKLCDFDNVNFKVSISPDDKDTMIISMNAPFWHEIADKGCSDAVQEYYGEYMFEHENNVDLKVNLNDFKDSADEFSVLVGNLKSNVIGGIFRRYFDAIRAEAPLTESLTVHLRGDTTMFLFPGTDRLVVFFAMDFVNKTDRVIANVLLGEFQEAKRKLGGAPICNFSQKMPPDLQGLGVQSTPDTGFLSIGVLKQHIATKEKAEQAASFLLGFRQFITYHIKCSKAFFHQRMRAQVVDFLKVLNRAKTEKEKAKKLYSGKTFKQ